MKCDTQSFAASLIIRVTPVNLVLSLSVNKSSQKLFFLPFIFHIFYLFSLSDFSVCKIQSKFNCAQLPGTVSGDTSAGFRSTDGISLHSVHQETLTLNINNQNKSKTQQDVFDSSSGLTQPNWTNGHTKSLCAHFLMTWSTELSSCQVHSHWLSFLTSISSGGSSVVHTDEWLPAGSEPPLLHCDKQKQVHL